MPTALELTREGWRHYIQAASRRLPSELTAAQKEERRQLLDKVRKVAALLKRRFGVRRVVLFGSLARTSGFVTGSDVDLAVEGLRSNEYWEAWGLAEEIVGDRQVDFVEIEAASPSLKRAIELQGVEL